MQGNEPQTPRFTALLAPRYLPLLVMVGLGVWLHAADMLLVATMMPAMVAELGGTELVAWTVALYEVGSIVAGAVSGYLALRHGVRGPMTVSALVFGAGCVVSALAPSMPVVLAGRLAQGFGGGALAALAFVAVGMLFPANLVPRVLAVVSAVWGASAFLGPLVGGVFVNLGSWRGGFWIFAGQALALAAWVASRRPEPRREALPPGRPPLALLALLAIGVVLVALGGNVPSVAWMTVSVVAGLACVAMFARLDASRGRHRLLPAGALRGRSRIGAALAMVLAFSIAAIGLGTYGPLLMTWIHDVAPLTAGFVLAAESVGWSIAAIAVSGVAERHDAKMVAVGMTLVAVSTIGLAVHLPGGPLWMVVPWALLAGGGFGMAWTFILRRSLADAPGGERERIAAALPTTQSLGYALGAAVLGIVANGAGIGAVSGIDDARAVATLVFLACLPFAAVGLVATWRFVQAPAGR